METGNYSGGRYSSGRYSSGRCSGKSDWNWTLQRENHRIIYYIVMLISCSSILNAIFYYHDTRKWTFLWNSFWGTLLKVGNYVLGTKTKLLVEPIFDLTFIILGIRNKIIEFGKFHICILFNSCILVILKFDILISKFKKSAQWKFFLVPRTQLPSFKCLPQKL